MAKHQVDREAVAAVRGRYYEALRGGMKREDAVRFANKGLRPSAAQSSDKSWPELVAEAAKYSDEPVSSRAHAEAIIAAGKVEIPEGWRELPWPELRTLGMKINGGSLGKMKRPDIEALIEAEQARRADDEAA